jgi:hypothetical protein
MSGLLEKLAAHSSDLKILLGPKNVRGKLDPVHRKLLGKPGLQAG